MLTNAQAALIAATQQGGDVLDTAARYLKWLEEAKDTRFQ